MHRMEGRCVGKIYLEKIGLNVAEGFGTISKLGEI